MADLALSIRAEDKASPALREVAKATDELGKGAQEATEEAKKMAAGLSRAASTAETAQKPTESLTSSLVKSQLAMAALQKAGEYLYNTIAGGVQGVLEAERADTRLAASLEQLGYASSRVLPGLKAQADALEETTLVSAEAIQEVQGLLLRFGTAPKDIGRVTQALLDYAAATGQDARQAAMTFTKAMQEGTGGLKALGIQVVDTGDETKNLDAAVAALTEKFGGSAATATQGLAGDMARLQLAQDKLSEAMGEFIVKTGLGSKVVAVLDEAVRGWTAFFAGPDNKEALERQQQLDELITLKTSLLEEYEHAARSFRATSELGMVEAHNNFARMEEVDRKLKDVEGRIADIRQQQADASGAGLGDASAEAKRVASEGRRRKAAEEDAKRRKEMAEEQAKREQRHAVEAQRREDEAYARSEKAGLEEEERARRAQEEQEAIWAEEDRAKRAQAVEDEAYRKAERESIAEETRRGYEQDKQMMIDALREQQEAMRAEQEAFTEVGLALGSALMDGIAEQIQRMKAGEEFDLGALIKGLIPMAAGLVGTLAGGPAAGAIAGQAAGLLTQLFHDGGQVRRFHTGGLAPDEVPAVLQVGEVVVNRRDVARNGGPEATQRLVKGGGGGGGVTIIQAFDARSIQDRIGSDIGAANVRVVQQNRGELAQLLRRQMRMA